MWDFLSTLFFFFSSWGGELPLLFLFVWHSGLVHSALCSFSLATLGFPLDPFDPSFRFYCFSFLFALFWRACLYLLLLACWPPLQWLTCCPSSAAAAAAVWILNLSGELNALNLDSSFSVHFFPSFFSLRNVCASQLCVCCCLSFPFPFLCSRHHHHHYQRLPSQQIQSLLCFFSLPAVERLDRRIGWSVLNICVCVCKYSDRIKIEIERDCVSTTSPLDK